MLTIERINQLEPENLQLKKILLDIKAMIKFECKCTNEQVCICHVCDKYDAIINKIDGVFHEVEHNKL